MSEEKSESLVLKGFIEVPYTWTTGPAASKFLTALRDDKKIWAVRCPSCKKVYIPPQEFCGACYVDATEWIECADEGTITAFTIFHKEIPEQPLKPPYAYALIRLDRNPDTDLVHIVSETDLSKLKNGMRVKAVWKEEREGSILDIKHFKPIEG